MSMSSNWSSMSTRLPDNRYAKRVPMLNESQLFTFIGTDRKFALYFLEGQKLIHDLVLTHRLRQAGISYFRSAVLSIQLMLGLLKQGEHFCFYVDSESPYFRLKIEMNAAGLMRGMLYPNELHSVPGPIQGQVRLVKFFPFSERPYQSTLEVRDVDENEIINHVLAQSYQVNSRISLSSQSDQSFMLHQLPLMAQENPSDLAEAFNQCHVPLQKIMAKGLSDKISLQEEFENIGFHYLANKSVQFKCGCSKEQMVDNVKKFADNGKTELFPPGEDTVEVVCEYCKVAYHITQLNIQEHSTAPS